MPPGGTTRLRLSETYTDSARYRLVGETLVWDRAFGRPANAVVLPAGWALTNSSIPATVSELPDGRPFVAWNEIRRSALHRIDADTWFSPLDWARFTLKLAGDGTFDGRFTLPGAEPLVVKRR